jgi:hypothetical protein
MGQQCCLLFRKLAEPVAAKIDFLIVLVAPIDRVTMLRHANLFEIVGIADVLEYLTICNNSAQVDNSLIAIVPDQLEDSLDYRFHNRDSENVAHRIFSGFCFAMTLSHSRINASRLVSAQDITAASFAGGR